MAARETFICIDVEASGPSPGTGSLISIGACLVTDPEVGFYREIRPLPGLPWDAATERIHRLSRQRLQRHGSDPAAAMEDLAHWVEAVAAGTHAVFVGFNAPFDWMFVADYFHRFLGRNPFGISALDLKSLYMGRHGEESWAATRHHHVSAVHPTRRQPTHHALDDARAQAEMAALLLAPHPALRRGQPEVETPSTLKPPST